uniref:Autophagy-related protein 2 n=1 Tax=Plectus sambesii TaxID=2011161 RepID=A0A914WI11_9BILA
MSLWGLSKWSDSVNKRMCRFLIHRYLGHLLKEKLSLEQLSVDVFNGTGTIQEVNVDVEYVNEILETLKVPIRLVDGYIGEITAEVPWAQLLNNSCLMEIKRLEVTIQPLKAVKLADLQPDLVSSMIESVIGSLASSMELAKSFLNEAQGEEETENEQEEGGVEAFAQIIDAIMSRMRLVFTDTVIRLENPPRPDSTLSTAIELQIDKIEFLDEQLEACEQQGTSKDTITTQPHSLYAVPDLNKILNLQGVRLYTDAFSLPEASDFPSMSGSSQVFTSMYVRRQEKAARKKSSTASSPSPTDEMTHSAASTTNFQSCYSHLTTSILPPTLADDLDSLSMTQSNAIGGGIDAPAKLTSDPIQFAAFTGEKQTIRLRLRNNTSSTSSERYVNNKVDVQMFLGGLAVFLTPSQLFILQSVVEKLLLPSTDDTHTDTKKCGKPMKQTDFARVEHQLQGDIDANGLWRTDFGAGNWAGEEKFFDTSRKPTLGVPNMPTVSDMSSVILDSAGASMGNEQLNLDNEMRKASRDSLSPRSPSHDVKPEVTQIKARLSSFWLTLTHKDPMSSGSGASDLSASVETIRAWSDHFFQSSSAVSYSARTNLKDIRSACDEACSLDQLRFIGCPLVFDYTIERGLNAESMVMNISAANCDFLECLSPSSVEAVASDGMTYVELATFAAHTPDDDWAAEEVPNFSLRLFNSYGLPHYKLSVELSPCRSQLDPSMVDRISHLTHCRPAFLSSSAMTTMSQRTVVASTGSVSSLELKEDLFMTAVTSKNAADTASTLEVDMRCTDWTIELR